MISDFSRKRSFSNTSPLTYTSEIFFFLLAAFFSFNKSHYRFPTTSYKRDMRKYNVSEKAILTLGHNRKRVMW